VLLCLLAHCFCPGITFSPCPLRLALPVPIPYNPPHYSHSHTHTHTHEPNCLASFPLSTLNTTYYYQLQLQHTYNTDLSLTYFSIIPLYTPTSSAASSSVKTITLLSHFSFSIFPSSSTHILRSNTSHFRIFEKEVYYGLRGCSFGRRLGRRCVGRWFFQHFGGLQRKRRLGGLGRLCCMKEMGLFAS